MRQSVTRQLRFGREGDQAQLAYSFPTTSLPSLTPLLRDFHPFRVRTTTLLPATKQHVFACLLFNVPAETDAVGEANPAAVTLVNFLSDMHLAVLVEHALIKKPGLAHVAVIRHEVAMLQDVPNEGFLGG